MEAKNLYIIKFKTLACIALVAAIGIIKGLVLLALISASVLLVLITTHARKKTGIKSIATIIIMAGLISLLQATMGETAIWKISFKGFSLGLYSEGLKKGVLTFFRIWCSYGLITILIKGIKLNELNEVFNWMRLPKAFCEVMLYAVKFIYIMKEESRTVIKAHRSRLAFKGIFGTASSLGLAAGCILLRSYDRSKTVAKAMTSRGYHWHSEALPIKTSAQGFQQKQKQ